MPRTVARTTEKQNDRLEQRALTLIVDKDGFLGWLGVRQVVKLERHVLHLRTGVQFTDVVYAITVVAQRRLRLTNCLPRFVSIGALKTACIIVVMSLFTRMATRIFQPTMARAVAAINNFVVGLAQMLGYSNLAAARRAFNAQIAAQLH